MLGHFLEWLISKFIPRTRLFREAKQRYTQWCMKLDRSDRSPKGPSAERRAQARQDQGLIEAEKLCRKAIRLSQEEQVNIDIAIGWELLGQIFYEQGRFAEAIEAFETALNINDDLISAGYVQQQQRSGCNYHLGLIALQQNNLPEAKHRLNISLKIDTDIQDWQSEALCREALNYCDELEQSSKAH